jgi:hypothetical protein
VAVSAQLPMIVERHREDARRGALYQWRMAEGSSKRYPDGCQVVGTPLGLLEAALVPRHRVLIVS